MNLVWYLPVFRAGYAAFPKHHDILGESTCLVCEHIFHLQIYSIAY